MICIKPFLLALNATTQLVEAVKLLTITATLSLHPATSVIAIGATPRFSSIKQCIVHCTCSCLLVFMLESSAPVQFWYYDRTFWASYASPIAALRGWRPALLMLSLTSNLLVSIPHFLLLQKQQLMFVSLAGLSPPPSGAGDSPRHAVSVTRPISISWWGGRKFCGPDVNTAHNFLNGESVIW